MACRFGPDPAAADRDGAKSARRRLSTWRSYVIDDLVDELSVMA
jgi:hypothetical protein